MFMLGSDFMDGFRIVFLDKNRDRDETWMGLPSSSFDISGFSNDDNRNIVLVMFDQAHPDCSVISCEPCTLEQFSGC